MPTTKEAPKKDSAFKTELLRLEGARHGIQNYSGARLDQKSAKLDFFVDRAIERGLTPKMVEANLAAGRPPLFVETGEAE